MSTYHPTPSVAASGRSDAANAMLGSSHRRTMNKYSNEWCAHCGNHALVAIDEPDPPRAHNIVAPCPMCQRGHEINIRQHNGAYWHHAPPGVTWENGLDHTMTRRCTAQERSGSEYPCGRPTATNRCTFHTPPGTGPTP